MYMIPHPPVASVYNRGEEKEQIMISVVIPTYNRRKLLERALDSVLAQTCTDIEVLVVDDLSDDGTEEYLKNHPDKRVRYLRLEEKGGACVARNTGIMNAKGDYIAFQDSDDEWLPEKLEKQLTFLQKNDADVVFCTCARYLGEGLLTDYLEGVEEGKIEYEQLLPKNLMSTQTIFGKRECFREEMFDPEQKRFQDWDLALRLAKKYRIYFQKEALAKAYIQENSITMDPVILFDALQRIYEKHIKAYANPITDRNWVTLSNGYRELIRKYEKLKEQNTHAEEMIAKAEKETEEVQKNYDEVVNSACWKITAPYRKVMDKLRRK